MIPCYVSGKGMYASEATWDFKTTVMLLLVSSGLGIDTRFRYYREQFPDKSDEDLARLVCDPIEYYDPDWPTYWANKKSEGRSKENVVTEYMLQLDSRFRREAKAAIVCFDEAGFGTGVNMMRFIMEKKPILGFYNPAHRKPDVNVSNIVQLQLEFGDFVTLEEYDTLDDIRESTLRYLNGLSSAV